MPKSIRAIFNWGMLTLSLCLVGGYFINELSTRYGIYIMIVLGIYLVSSVSYIREKLEMFKVENEINIIIRDKELNEFKEHIPKNKRVKKP